MTKAAPLKIALARVLQWALLWQLMRLQTACEHFLARTTCDIPVSYTDASVTPVNTLATGTCAQPHTMCADQGGWLSRRRIQPEEIVSSCCKQCTGSDNTDLDIHGIGRNLTPAGSLQVVVELTGKAQVEAVVIAD